MREDEDADDSAREAVRGVSREATTTLGGRRAMMMSMMSMMTMISAPRDARAETKEASHALEKLTRGIPDPWAEARRGARARAGETTRGGRRRRRVSRETRTRERTRASRVRRVRGEEQKTRVRLERDGELGEGGDRGGGGEGGERGEGTVERGTEAEEAVASVRNA